MKVYLDSSAIVRRVLNEPHPLPEWGKWEASFTSELTRLEAIRTFERLRLEGRVDDADIAKRRSLFAWVLESAELIVLSRPVLERAERSFPTVVGALDSIHLASAVLKADELGEPLVFLTHDRRLGIAARALGFDVRGVANL